MATRSLLAFLFCCVCLIGCGPERASVTTSDIKGQVTVNGTPVDRATIKFVPVDPTKGQETVCLIEKGNYGSKISHGQYKVQIEPLTGGMAIPQKYRSINTSGFTVDVSGDKEEDFPLK